MYTNIEELCVYYQQVSMFRHCTLMYIGQYMIKLTEAFHLLPFCFQKSCHNRGQLLVLNCGVAEPGFLPVAGANFDILQPLIKLLRLQTKKCWAESRSRMDFNIAMVRSRPKKDQLRNTANQWNIQALFNISFITCTKSLKNIFMGYLDSSHLYETVSWDFWPLQFFVVLNQSLFGGLITGQKYLCK